MRTRLLRLLGVLTILFIVAVSLLNTLERARIQTLYGKTHDEKETLFDRLVELTGVSISTLASDYTYWDDMVRFVQTGDRQWAEENIDTAMQTFAVDAVWIYTASGHLVYAVGAVDAPRLKEVQLPPGAPQTLFASRRFAHFFAQTPHGIIEIRGATIHPTADSRRVTPARGYFFAGRLWTQTYVAELATLTETSLRIVPVLPGAPPAAVREEPGTITFTRLLPGWDGRPLARLNVRSSPATVKELARSANELMILATLFAAAMLGLLSLFLWRWVTSPLDLISASLTAGSPAPIASLLTDRTEFGRLAGLIQRFFNQRATLESEVRDRASAEAEVRRLNAELEQRVVDRTAQLADREHELRQATGFLEHLVASAPGVIFRRRPDDHTLTYVSPTIRTVMGYAPEEVVGVREWWPRVIHPEDQAAILDQVREGLERRAAQIDYEYRHRHQDGGYRWFHTVLRPEYDETGTVVDMFGYALDVTDRKQAERRLGAQNAVTRILAEALTLPQATPGILRALCETLGWQLGGLWVVDPSANVLRLLEMWHASPGDVTAFIDLSRRTAFPPGRGLPGRVWASGRPAWIPDVVEDENFPRAPIAAQIGLHGAFGFPIRIGSAIFGVLEFFSHEIRQPDDELLGMMEAVGSQIGQFIERRRAERAVRDSEARKGAILETALDCIITIDHQGKILEFNPAAERTFGYSRTDALGREIDDLILPPAQRGMDRPGLARYLSTGKGPVLGEHVEMPAVHADGTEFPVELSIARIPLDGPPIFTAYVRDITNRKRDEETLRQSRDEAERASRAKSDFLSRMSHELRTPLNAILGFAQLLEMDSLTAEQREGVAHILQGGRHLLDLINEVLDIARIETGRLRLSLEPVALEGVVGECLDLIAPLAAERNVRLHGGGEEGWRRHVLADRQRLKQVLLNLLTNAVKYNREGGLVSIACAGTAYGSIRVTVRDTGPGIPAEMLGRLFVPFERLGDQSGVEGTGIGLAISKKLVELMRGHIGVESKVGQGSTFWMELESAGVGVRHWGIRPDPENVLPPG